METGQGITEQLVASAPFLLIEGVALFLDGSLAEKHSGHRLLTPLEERRATIEDDAFIGSNSALVAPVTVGKGATVGAGSAINRDVAPGQLVVTRADQTVRDEWQRPAKNASKKSQDA